MRKVTIFLLLCASGAVSMQAQRVLTLDSCRAMALSNNKQLSVSRLNQEMTSNARKAMRTKYLPKVDAIAGYQWTSRETSLLSDQQKERISNMGTSGLQLAGADITAGLTSKITDLVQQGLISMQQAQQLGQLLQQVGPGPIGQHIAGVGNKIGQEVTNAFKTDTRNIFGGAIVVRQPVYMGGGIIAANKMADIGEQMAQNDLSLKTQSTLYNIDHAYWLVVSLRQKYKLAMSFRNLVYKLNHDVEKMMEQGVATKADGLRVSVKVNEADMNVTKVEDGMVLAKTLLCQLCGLPMDSNITLADEESDQLDTSVSTNYESPGSILSSRPELRLLQNAVEMSEQSARLIHAAYLPHVMATGGYFISNPNVYNGFQKKFSGAFNIGLLVQVPIWNWGEGNYKVKAARAATKMARMELNDLEEKIQLQITQCRFKLSEAQKRMAMALKNIESANENLRTANLGFREGVLDSKDVMAAQTAWEQALSQKIDAQIELKLAQVELKKALGVLN